MRIDAQGFATDRRNWFFRNELGQADDRPNASLESINLIANAF